MALRVLRKQKPNSALDRSRNRRVHILRWDYGGQLRVRRTGGSAVPSRVFGVRNLRGIAKGEQDARRGPVFDL